MKQINGFTVIAETPVEHGFRTDHMILGHRENHGHEYVVAALDAPDATSWGQGFYTWSLPQAMGYYVARGGK